MDIVRTEKNRDIVILQPDKGQKGTDVIILDRTAYDRDIQRF